MIRFFNPTDFVMPGIRQLAETFNAEIKHDGVGCYCRTRNGNMKELDLLKIEGFVLDKNYGDLNKYLASVLDEPLQMENPDLNCA